VDPNTPAEEKGIDKQFEMEILIKCADTSNVLKPFPIAKKWAMRVTDEFFLQVIMQHAAMHLNALWHTATSCNSLQYTAKLCKTLHVTHRQNMGHASHRRVLPAGDTATQCNILQYTAAHCNILQLTAIYCNTLHYTAIHPSPQNGPCESQMVPFNR